MFKKTTIIFSLLLGILFLSNTINATETSPVKPYMNSIQTADKAYVPFSSMKIKTPISKPATIVACEKSYTIPTEETNIPSSASSFQMNVYRHAILNGKLKCEYKSYPPGDEQAQYATKYLATPEGTTCSAIPDFKFSCEITHADTCPTTCKRE